MSFAKCVSLNMALVMYVYQTLFKLMVKFKLHYCTEWLDNRYLIKQVVRQEGCCMTCVPIDGDVPEKII